MPTRITGTYERSSLAGEEVDAFIPAPLPPSDPPLEIEALQGRINSAEQALARLELAAEMVPSMDWFNDAFVRKEAVLSSQIEGTQATLTDLLAFEAEDGLRADADVEEVCNYIEALTYALSELHADRGLPLFMRLLNEAHRRLMQGVRGGDKRPGVVRTSQNWIGGTRPSNATFVPPPPQALSQLLSQFEKYLHAEDQLSPLVRAGLLHVQFETIHPYLDGNGRIGRLLVTLLIEHWGLLSQPLLYLSLFIKRHQQEYYRRLNAVRTDGDWEAWLDYFLDGVATIANEAAHSARDLFRLVADDRTKVLQQATSSLAAVRLFEELPYKPIVSVASIMTTLEVSKPTVARAIEVLEAAGVLVETTGKKRDRSWSYQAYLNQLKQGTDLV